MKFICKQKQLYYLFILVIAYSCAIPKQKNISKKAIYNTTQTTVLTDSTFTMDSLTNIQEINSVLAKSEWYFNWCQGMDEQYIMFFHRAEKQGENEREQFEKELGIDISSNYQWYTMWIEFQDDHNCQVRMMKINETPKKDESMKYQIYMDGNKHKIKLENNKFSFDGKILDMDNDNIVIKFNRDPIAALENGK